jgi:hypothetical protein
MAKISQDLADLAERIPFFRTHGVFAICGVGYRDGRPATTVTLFD